MRTWGKSYVEGCYVSANGRVRAELRQAGYSHEAQCKMVRHYALFVIGGNGQPFAFPRTLKEAEGFLS